MPIAISKPVVNEQPIARPKTTLLRDAQAAIRIRDNKPFDFTPIEIKGESLSETIIRERRREF